MFSFELFNDIVDILLNNLKERGLTSRLGPSVVGQGGAHFSPGHKIIQLLNTSYVVKYIKKK